MYKADKQQIAEWKAKHGRVFRIQIEEYACYLKTPSRKVLGYAAAAGRENPLKFNEIILRDCWLAGDEEIRTDDSLFLGVSQKLSEVVEVKEAELEEL